MRRQSKDALTFTAHGARRSSQRRLSRAAISAALDWGRMVRSHGDQIYRLDRRSVSRARAAGVLVDKHEGVTVVLTPDGRVRTAYRNRQPKRIRR